jgi:hypothetical protein
LDCSVTHTTSPGNARRQVRPALQPSGPSTETAIRDFAASLSIKARVADSGVTQTASVGVAFRFTKPVLQLPFMRRSAGETPEPTLALKAAALSFTNVVVVATVVGATVVGGCVVGVNVVAGNVVGAFVGATVAVGAAGAATGGRTTGTPPDKAVTAPAGSTCMVHETAGPQVASFFDRHAWSESGSAVPTLIPAIVRAAKPLRTGNDFVTGLPEGEDQLTRITLVAPARETRRVDFLSVASTTQGALGSAHVVAACALTGNTV